MDEVLLALRVFYAAVLSFLIGWEREYAHKPAGLRTHILVGMGAATFAVLSLYGFPGGDPARVAAYVVAGIGFVGAGAIVQMENKVQGLTTAASLWLTAAVGLSAGAGFYILALLVSLAGFVVLFAKDILHRLARF